jgi:hypothetical protein
MNDEEGINFSQRNSGIDVFADDLKPPQRPASKNMYKPKIDPNESKNNETPLN